MNKTLLLQFVGPLQSWGTESYFDIRETNLFPTKSAAIGLLAAALGRKREDDNSDLSKLLFGVRIDYPGKKIHDFQITKMKTYEKMYQNNLSHKYYLSDAYFLAGFYGDEEFLKEIEYALKHPVFSLFLGRKSCPPGLPVCLGIRDTDLYHSLYIEEWLLPEWRRKEVFRFQNDFHLRIIMDDIHSYYTMKDFPVSFSFTKREYSHRRISEMTPKIEHNKYTACTEHDVMSVLV